MSLAEATTESWWTGESETFSRIARVKDTSYEWNKLKPSYGDVKKFLPPRYSEVRTIMVDLIVESKEQECPVNAGSYEAAESFLCSLPDDIALPELWCEASGIVIADWAGDKCAAAVAFEGKQYGVVGYGKSSKDFIEKTKDRLEVLEYVRNLLN